MDEKWACGGGRGEVEWREGAEKRRTLQGAVRCGPGEGEEGCRPAAAGSFRVPQGRTVEMGIFDKVKAMFGVGGSGRGASKSFLVDAGRLLDEKTGRRLSPREQLALLGALGRLAKQEEFEVAVLFESDRPLREAEEGAEYQGVTVYYAESSDELIEKALKLSKKGGRVLVTCGPNLESRATEAKVPLLSCSTFRKAFLQGFAIKDGGGEGHGGRRGEGRRGHDRRRDRGRGRGGKGGGGGNGGASAPESAPAEGAQAPSGGGEGGGESGGGSSGGGDAAVRNLIDLVE